MAFLTLDRKCETQCCPHFAAIVFAILANIHYLILWVLYQFPEKWQLLGSTFFKKCSEARFPKLSKL